MTNSLDQSFSISETATKLALSEKTLRRWEDAGRFSPSRTTGNQRRYSLSDLQILDAIKHDLIPSQNDLLTKEAAAQFLGVTEPTIDRYVGEGKLHPFITVENSFYPRNRLIPLLSDLKVKPRAPISNTSKPTESLTRTPPKLNNAPYFINLAFTLIIITLYHLLFRTTPTPPTSPLSDSGSVQGASTNPSLKLLDDMLDPTTGGLTATTVISKLGTTTPNLSLIPSIAPSSPITGSLYYDSSDNTLRIYTPTGWQVLSTTLSLESLRFDLESKIVTQATESKPDAL